MRAFPHIISPKWRTALSRARQGQSGSRGKIAIIGTVGLFFWLAVFGVLYRVLVYFRGVE